MHFEKYYLGDDGAKFAAGGGDSMCSRAVARGENLPRDDEGRHVRTKISEKGR